MTRDTDTSIAAVPAVSVVVPMRNGGADFDACLQGIARSTIRDYELIVVDDGSSDDSASRALASGARLIRHERPLGPAASRNAGAKAATAPVVFFVDADVVLHPDVLEKAVDRFEADPGLAALFGSYDDRPTAPGVVSAFRNLLHHFTHQQGEFRNNARPAHTFWTGCGAIRRSVLLELGGFDPGLYRKPAIEDIELGYRLTQAGHRIELVRDILSTHRKRWTLASMIRTDIFCRGVPWMLLLMWSGRKENDLNVNSSQRLSVACAGLFLVAVSLVWLHPALAALAACSLALIFAMNRAFYRFLAARRGLAFAALGFGLHFVYFVCCGTAVAVALALRLLLERQSSRLPHDQRYDRADAPSFPRPSVAVRRRSRGRAKT